MEAGVRLVLKLVCIKPAVPFRELLRLQHHARAAELRRRDDDLRAEHAHHFPALHGEGRRHRGDEAVAALGAEHGQGDARVPARGLHDRAARPQLPPALRVMDGGQGEPVLQGAARVEVLALYIEVHARRRQAVDPDDRGVADGAGDVVVNCPAGGRGGNVAAGPAGREALG
eukprot:CAMPEP_0170287060 /NCGR_PEP_ID=MMETSP0116_2-20130129/43582_1 /TAXON_ID=400756 /ORGANISM="Durinskia baltica, Strain CSIRO CS-38" /LENGTH=171 /DNA_ID=CAMNT_0010538467 /DNA_START=73 /DNA_END=588 /DNA_ORIENTATION=-